MLLVAEKLYFPWAAGQLGTVFFIHPVEGFPDLIHEVDFQSLAKSCADCKICYWQVKEGEPSTDRINGNCDAGIHRTCIL